MELFFIGLGLATLCVGGFIYSSTGGVGTWYARSRLRTLPPSPAPQPFVAATLPGDKLAALETFHANHLNTISLTIAELTPHLLQGVSFFRLGRAMAERQARLGRDAEADDPLLKAAGSIQRDYLQTLAENALKNAAFRRTLRDMTDAERATLRLADLLAAAGYLTVRERLTIFAPIIWNKGQGLLLPGGQLQSADLLADLRETLTTLIEGHLGPVQAATERLQGVLRDALGPDSRLTGRERTVLERLLITGAKWMPPEMAGTALVYQMPVRASVLRLGRIEGSDRELLYDRNESLITIAPPGQGKSQSVMRNLLTMDGGAVVIDIKGELYDQTAVWRARNVGPVYRFAPGDPSNSIHFNPLDTVRPGLADAYDDAKKLVSLLMVPQEAGKKDYWDKRGLALLADAIFDTALFEKEPEKRTMSSVFERLYLAPVAEGSNDQSLRGSELELWLDHLESSGVKRLARTGKAVRAMPYKVRESVTDTARTHVDAWEAPRIEDLSSRSTFDPLSLRRDKATLYVCISLDDLENYTSFFRALIGQTFFALCRGDADRNAPVVTFYLDEMPRFRRLDILETALDLGRGYGVRLWMFAQNYGQIVQHYENPMGFLENSFVRQFMGISGQLALNLSQQLSERHGLIDGRRHPLVEPHELTGEAFRDLTLTVAQGYPPARVVKAYGFADYADRIVSARAFRCPDGRLDVSG